MPRFQNTPNMNNMLPRYTHQQITVYHDDFECAIHENGRVTILSPDYIDTESKAKVHDELEAPASLFFKIGRLLKDTRRPDRSHQKLSIEHNGFHFTIQENGNVTIVSPPLPIKDSDETETDEITVPAQLIFKVSRLLMDTRKVTYVAVNPRHHDDSTEGSEG